MRSNALLLCLFGTNCNIFLFSTVWLIWNSHFKLATCQSVSYTHLDVYKRQ